MRKKPVIGAVIRNARERKKLTADDLARLCNVSRSNIYSWEATEYILPKNLPALSRALGISERYLKSINGESKKLAA